MLAETVIECPHCGESWVTVIDTSQGDYETVEDCTVCCRPMVVRIQCVPGEVMEVTTEAA